jgi:Zn2+/Cd2+-exporting ATPase
MNAKWNSRITLAAGLLLAAALLLHYAGFHAWRQAVLVLSTLIAEAPIAVKAFRALRMRAFSIDLLVTIAVIGALAIGEYVESAVVTFLFLFGAYLEARTLEKTRSSLKALMDMSPQQAKVIRDGAEMVIPAEDVAAGDRVLIRSGEKVAADGAIASGQASMNEAAITGESVPASKTVNDRVFSGSIVDHGFIEVIAERVGDDTTFARIIELVEEAQEAKTKAQTFLDQFARIYTPAIVVLSVLVFAWTRNAEMAITFLVIACPGALVIGAPVSVVSGIGNGARHGVLIKGGDVMERLSKIDTLVFDKTGTLTRGHPEVTEIRPLGPLGLEENVLLRLVAEAETISEHHLGQTIVKEAKARQLKLMNEPLNAEVIKGNGIRARVDGQWLVIGNRKLMEAEGVVVAQEAQAYAVHREKLGNTAIFAAVDGMLAGVISIADQIRPEAEQAIGRLRDHGIRQIIMLTGDNRHTAELVSSQLGLDEVHAELLPEDKAAFVRSLRDSGRRALMAGDGINDAPAIATADIGLAMGEGGTDISMETADIVLMADRLDQLAHAYSLSKATVRNMKQNIGIAVGTVVLLLLGVLVGKIFLASGMFIHELSVLLVILNAIRLNKGIKPKELKRIGSRQSQVMPS